MSELCKGCKYMDIWSLKMYFVELNSGGFNWFYCDFTRSFFRLNINDLGNVFIFSLKSDS